MGGIFINKQKVKEKIINYIVEKRKVTIGEIYIKFHMMNKGNEFLGKGDMPISAQEIEEYLEELKNQGIIYMKNGCFCIK